MEYVNHYDSPLGGITLTGDGEALTGLRFDDQRRFADMPDRSHEAGELPVFRETKRWLDLYFCGKEPGFTPKLSTRTTEFREIVWRILLTIPYGKTVTYGEIADRAAKQMHLARMSAQAVGGAVEHNAIALIIPCHRVIGANGAMTGYAGGIERKVKLLEMERKARSEVRFQDWVSGMRRADIWQKA